MSGGIGGEDGPSARVKRKAAAIEDVGAAKPPVAAVESKPDLGSQTAEPSDEVLTAAADAEHHDDAPPVQKTRRSRRDGGALDFDVPDKYRRTGYDYEWKTTKINGQEVDGADLAFYNEQGWEPVVAGSMKGMLAPGSTAKYIERRGQILMTRPMHLTEEARAEDYEIAETQKYDKLLSASAVPMARPGLVATKPEISIEGVVGSHKPGPKA